MCVIDESAVQHPRNLPLLPTQKPSYQPLISASTTVARLSLQCVPPWRNLHDAQPAMCDEHQRFCHVCRYVLVDVIDPAKHGDLDVVYFKEYAD